MNSEAFAVFIEKLFLNLHSNCIRVSILKGLNMKSAYSMALIQAPEMPFLDLNNTFNVSKSL
jgi:hypothetical protein